MAQPETLNKPKTPSEKQEQRILGERSAKLLIEEEEIQKRNNKLVQDNKALEAGIFRLENDYARHNQMIERLLQRKAEVEQQLDAVYEELKAKKSEL